MIDIRPLQNRDVLLVHVVLGGTLTQLEYNVFGPSLGAILSPNPQVNLLIELEEDLKWEARSMWRGLKLSGPSSTNLIRLAIVGDEKAWHGEMVPHLQTFRMTPRIGVTCRKSNDQNTRKSSSSALWS